MASCIPFLVGHFIPNLFAINVAARVEPLLPPMPTNITPRRGTFLAVRKVYLVVTWRQNWEKKKRRKKTNKWTARNKKYKVTSDIFRNLSETYKKTHICAHVYALAHVCMYTSIYTQIYYMHKQNDACILLIKQR